MASWPTSLPVFILTGFLGSGKTTFLNQLLQNPDNAATAVLVNEFGEIGIDHLLVDTIDDEILLLESGCVCCSVRDDLSAALLNIIEKCAEGLLPPLSRIVLETTGVADPAALLQFLMERDDLNRHFIIGGVLTVIDTVYGEKTLQEHPEAERQAAMADVLIFSKTDISNPKTLDRLKQKLNNMAHASLILNSNDKIDFAAIFDNRQKKSIPEIEYKQPAGHPAGHGFSSFVLSWNSPVIWNDFKVWLEGLLIARGDDIYRLKGLVHVEGKRGPIVIQGVQHTFYEPTMLDKWPARPPRTELVFITRYFTKSAAYKSLDPFMSLSKKL